MAKWFSADDFSTKKARKILGTNLRVLRFEICGNITLHILPRSIFILISRNYKLEMAIFPRNPGPEPATPPHNFGWAQHQAQHSFLGPASGPAVYHLSIRPLMLSLWRAQQPHVRPIKKSCAEQVSRNTIIDSKLWFLLSAHWDTCVSVRTKLRGMLFFHFFKSAKSIFTKLIGARAHWARRPVDRTW